jgi:hypothetical protein
MTSTPSSTGQVNTYRGLMAEVVGRVEEALAGGAQYASATDISLHIAHRFRYGLWSRALD